MIEIRQGRMGKLMLEWEVRSNTMCLGFVYTKFNKPKLVAWKSLGERGKVMVCTEKFRFVRQPTD
jgi:hypothetical protein